MRALGVLKAIPGMLLYSGVLALVLTACGGTVATPTTVPAVPPGVTPASATAAVPAATSVPPTTAPATTLVPVVPATATLDPLVLDLTQVEVLPSLSRLNPEEAGRGEEVEIEGIGGLIRLVNDDGGVVGHIESAKSFSLFFDGEPIGSIVCFVGRSAGALTVPSYAVPGDHEVSVEGGSTQVLTVTEPIAGTRETPPPTIGAGATETPPTIAPVTPQTPTATPIPTATQVPFALSTAAFAPGGPIPARYTCDGQDVSPVLSWNEPPLGTETFAIIMDDPDAPGGAWVHWVVYNLPSDLRELPESQPTTEQLPNGGVQGRNSWPKIGYGGPCPPGGPAHTYRFFLYAVDTALDLPVGASKEQVLKAIEGRILGESVLTGTYGR